MSKIASIKIGLLGGRSYGKTVFLTKLISLADTNTDGFLQFDAGSEALQIKNAMLENDGRLPATTIKEISKYNFILGKQSGEKWRVQFCDYAGELLERIDIKDTSENSEQSDFTANAGNAAYIKRIKKWLKHCDACIVLMPEDITNKELYPTSEVNIFKQNIGVILKIMQDDPILKKRPVCLAINKWDLTNNQISFDEFIKQEPFASFRQQLLNLCGDNLFCLPISAFGKHDANDPTKADPSGKPFQVSEMLVSLASQAEYRRVSSVCQAVKRLPKWVGWPLIPFILFTNTLKGVTCSRLKRLNSLSWKKYGIRFAINSLVTVFCTALIISSANIVHLGVELLEIQRQLDNGFNSPTQIAEVEKKLHRTKTFNFVFRYQWGKLRSLASLREQCINSKKQYNDEVIKNVETFVRGQKTQLEDISLAPSIREQRIGEVLGSIDAARKKLTADSIYFSRLDTLKQEISIERSRLTENRPFDEAYQKWLSIPDDYEKARQAIVFLKEYTEARFPERKACIENVRRTRKSIEDKKYNDLLMALRREIYKNDFGPQTDSYTNRIKRAESRILEITQEMEKLPLSCHKNDYIALKKAEEDRIVYLRTYGPFDVEVERLLTLSDKGCIKKIIDFIALHKRTFEEKRSTSFKKLEKRIVQLNEKFYNELLRILNTPQYMHDRNADYKKQIDLAKRRIEIIKQFIPEFSIDLYVSQCNELISAAQAIQQERALYGPFEVAYRELQLKPDEKKITAIEDFFAQYPEIQYPAKKQIYSELEKQKLTMSDDFYKKLLSEMPMQKKDAKWREQKAIAENRIQFIKNEQKKFSQTSKQWANCEKLIQEEQRCISELEYNGKFDDAYDALIKKKHDKTFIWELYVFFITYNEKTFPARASVVVTLRKEMNDLEQDLFRNLHQLDLTKAKTWQEKCALLNARIKQIRDDIRFFTDSSPYVRKLQEDIRKFTADAKNIELYGKFDDQWAICQNDLAGKTIAHKIKLLDAFLSTHSMRLYPERDQILTKIATQVETFNQEIRKSTLENLGSSNYADDEQLRWDIKIHRAEARIKILQTALESFSISTPYRDEFANKIAVDRELIKTIRAYEVYYKEYTIVENKSSFYKIPAIDDFIKKFKGQYPAPLVRYTIERLIQQKQNLLKSFNMELAQQLKMHKDNKSLTWKERLNKALMRKEAQQNFQNATGISRTNEISSIDIFIKQCNENIAFEDSYANIKKGFENPYDLFVAVHDFYKRYPYSQWGNARAEEFKTISQKLKDKSVALLKLLDAEIAKITEPDDLSEAETALRRKIALYEGYLKKFLPQMQEYKCISERLELANIELRRINEAKLAQSKIKALLAEGKRLSSSSPDQIGIFLIGISDLLKSYPEASIHRFVIDEYRSLIKMRDEWNAKLYDQMRADLKPFEDSLKNELSDDEKTAVYDQILRIREKYLSLFSTESSQYNLVKREYDNSYKSQSQLKKEQEIKTALEDLTKTLQDEPISAAHKLKKIKIFWEQLAAHGHQEQFPRFRSEFAYVNEMQKILTWDHAYDELCGRIKYLLQNQPSGDDEAKMITFVKNCRKHATELEPFVSNPRTENNARTTRLSLSAKIANCEKILTEWELYRAVKSAHTDFIKNPSDITYKTFEDSVWRLQRHDHQNLDHQRDITELSKRNKEINVVRQELDRAFQNFRNRRNAASLNSLCQIAIKYVNLGQKNKITGYVMRLSCASFEPKSNAWIYNPQPLGFGIVLHTYNFSNSGFKSSWGIDVDLFVQITGATNYIVFDVDNISGRNKNNQSHEFLLGRLGTAGVRRSGYTSIQNAITCEFKNDNCRDDVGSETVEFAYILGKAMDNGECYIDFISTSSRRPNAGRGSVRIKFTGLPRFQ